MARDKAERKIVELLREAEAAVAGYKFTTIEIAHPEGVVGASAHRMRVDPPAVHPKTEWKHVNPAL
ncbi:MAG TPA: hypothetical protein VGC00_15555, partial [Thermoanaerobaculia bacterium]